MNIIGVTNRKLCSDFYKRIEELSKENLKYLILREKDLGYKELTIMAKKVKSILLGSNIGLIVNGSLEIAKKVEAKGVQLSFNDFKKQGTFDYEGIIGVSIHSIEEALEVDKIGASYLIYGHVFETDCKRGIPPRGLVELEKICKKVNLPVYAIGGINERNAKVVIKSGAYGVAYMSSLMTKNSLE